MLTNLHKETKILAEVGYADEPGQIKYLTMSFVQHIATCGDMAEFCPVSLMAKNKMISSGLNKMFLTKREIATKGAKEGTQDSFIFNSGQVGSDQYYTEEEKLKQAESFLTQFHRACTTCRNHNK